MFDWQEYNKKGWGPAFLGCSAQQDLPTHGWRLVKQMSSPLTGPLVPHGPRYTKHPWYTKDLYLDVGEQPKDEAPAGVRKGFPGSPLWWQLIYPKEQQGIKKVNCQYLHISVKFKKNLFAVGFQQLPDIPDPKSPTFWSSNSSEVAVTPPPVVQQPSTPPPPPPTTTTDESLPIPILPVQTVEAVAAAAKGSVRSLKQMLTSLQDFAGDSTNKVCNH